MNPLFIIRSGKSMKIEFVCIFAVIMFLVTMPVMATFALTGTKSITQSTLYGVTNYPGDEYAWGNCTWWAAMRRSQIGEPIPNSWGNAATWAYYAQFDGYVVDHTPSFGAIMQISDVDGGLGHVAFVESVDQDGTWNISEMNVLGLDVVDYKSMPANQAMEYNFIHTQQIQ